MYIFYICDIVVKRFHFALIRFAKFLATGRCVNKIIQKIQTYPPVHMFTCHQYSWKDPALSVFDRIHSALVPLFENFNTATPKRRALSILVFTVPSSPHNTLVVVRVYLWGRENHEYHESEPLDRVSLSLCHKNRKNPLGQLRKNYV